MKNKEFKSFGVVVMFLCTFLIFVGANAKDKKSKKSHAKITFEKCCEENENDTAKCMKMKNVKSKKAKKGKKWVAKECPKPAVQEPEPDVEEESDAAEEDGY